MKIVYLWRHPQRYSYLLTNQDGHFETLRYLARYYDVHVIAPCLDLQGVVARDGFTVWMLPVNRPEDLVNAVKDREPDAVCCYGPCDEPEWPMVRAACPNAVLCLDYAGGPLVDLDGHARESLGIFDHVFVAHDTQAELLQGLGVPASKARGVPLNIYRPLPNVPKLWRVFCPTTFVPGKRPALVAQYLEQYRFAEPSLFLGAMEQPAVVDMVKVGGVPLNKWSVPRANLELGDRAPYAVMPLLYNASRVVITGSQEEAGPWTPMEALACGTPAIVMADCEWNVAEAFERIAEGFRRAGRSDETPLVVCKPWPAAIAEAVEYLLTNYAARSEAAREAAAVSFDWWAMYEGIDGTLKQLVGLKQAGQTLAALDPDATPPTDTAAVSIEDAAPAAELGLPARETLA